MRRGAPAAVPHGAAVALAMLALATIACGRVEPDGEPAATPTLIPATDQVRAGGVLDVTYRFDVSATPPPAGNEYLVFVHAVDESGRLLWTDDHAPETPTSGWEPGAVIEYTRRMLVPRRAPQGLVHLDAGLYLPRSGERLPLQASAGSRRSYRLASVRVLAPADASEAIFTDGWYDVEHAGDAAGTEWRWSDREGEIWFRNPRHDSTLVLRLDGSIAGVTAPRRVELKLGSAVVDRFDVPQGALLVRTVPLASSRLGDDDIVRLLVVVDNAIAPASVAGGGNPDSRTLGVRVFEAYLEPPLDP